MYIPEFWAGVIVTLFAEFVAIIIWAIVNKKKEVVVKNENDKNNN